jgi:Schlafen, AlbA_2
VRAPSLRLLSLGDLATSEDTLKALLAESETLFVEHKTDIAKGEGYQLAKAVASFANTLGGWVLVGVKDGGKPISGWTPPAGGFVDCVRQRLERQVDPVPSIAADVLPIGNDQIGVVRVYESADTPHILMADGSIVVREPAQDARLRKLGRYEATPIRSHIELAQLAQRGQEAERAARERFEKGRLPLLEDSLDYHWYLGATQQHVVGERLGGEGPAVVVRAAPLNMSSRWREWSVSRSAVDALKELVDDVLDGGVEVDEPTPHPSGISITARQESGERWTHGGHRSIKRVATAAADAGGAIGLRLGFSIQEVDGNVNDWRKLEDAGELEGLVGPLVQKLAATLADAEHLGRFAMHVIWLAFGTLFRIDPNTEQGHPISPLPGGGMLMIDGLSDTTEQDDLVRQWSEELLRSAGIAVWQQGRTRP